MNWDEWRYGELGLDIALNNLSSTEGAEQFATTRAKHRVAEEVLETFLMLHLEEMTGLPLYFVSRGHEYWGAEDLIAWDELGRVHLFELKKGAIKAETIDQLTQYMMRYLFHSVDGLVEEEWRRGTKILDISLSTHLAAACAGWRLATMGHGALREDLFKDIPEWITYPTWPPSRYWWNNNASDIVKNRLLLKNLALMINEELPEQSRVSADTFRNLAKFWTKRLKRPARPPHKVVSLERPVVLWFVGSGFEPGAWQPLRKWRALGVDARPLVIDLRHPAPGKWTLRWRKEQFPQRDELEVQLFERARSGKFGGINRLPKLKLELYKQSSASAKIEDSHGYPLEHPRARLEVFAHSSWQDIL